MHIQFFHGHPSNGYEVCGNFPFEHTRVYPLHKMADAFVGFRLSSNSMAFKAQRSGGKLGSGKAVRLIVHVRGCCACTGLAFLDTVISGYLTLRIIVSSMI